LGDHHADTAISLDSMGMLHWNEDDIAQARSYFEGALAVREAALGDNHPDVAISLAHLGALARSQHDSDLARHYFQRAQAICELQLGHDHPTTRAVRSDLSVLDSWSYQASQRLAEWTSKLNWRRRKS
jgi:tetratricopeptide (TPR) repeat protein